MLTTDDLGPTLLSFRTADQHHDSSYMDPYGVEIESARVLLDTAVVGLYFADADGIKCQMLSRYLHRVYKTASGLGKSFEVILVSTDVTIEAFHRQFQKMPWTSLPFSGNSVTPSRVSALLSKFGVTEFPTLVLFDASGNFLTIDGLSTVLGDPNFTFFPWDEGQSSNRELLLIVDQISARNKYPKLATVASAIGTIAIASVGVSLLASEEPMSATVRFLGLLMSISLGVAAFADPGMVDSCVAVPEGPDWAWSEETVGGWVPPSAKYCIESGQHVRGYGEFWRLIGSPVGDDNRVALIVFLSISIMTAICFLTILMTALSTIFLLGDIQTKSSTGKYWRLVGSPIDDDNIAIFEIMFLGILVMLCCVATLFMGNWLVNLLPRSQRKETKLKLT